MIKIYISWSFIHSAALQWLTDCSKHKMENVLTTIPKTCLGKKEHVSEAVNCPKLARSLMALGSLPQTQLKFLPITSHNKICTRRIKPLSFLSDIHWNLAPRNTGTPPLIGTLSCKHYSDLSRKRRIRVGPEPSSECTFRLEIRSRNTAAARTTLGTTISTLS